MSKLDNKPIYKIGDRIEEWEVKSVNYRGEQFGYVYDVIKYVDNRKVEGSITEKAIAQLYSQSIKQK